MPEPRVVSLLPSATEIVAAIGGERLLVGRSHECDHPTGLGHLPALTAQTTHYDPDAGVCSRAIDEAVRAQRARGSALYTLDEGALAALEPDVIITQDLCDVCSVDLPAVERAADLIASTTGSRPEVIALNPTTLEGVIDAVLTVGGVIGLETEARDFVIDLRGRLHTAAEVVNPYDDGPVVGFCEWTEPVFVAGHWNVQIIERAGGRHPLNAGVPRPTSGAAAGPQMAERVAGKSIAVPDELFCAAAPEWLIVAPCGLTLDQAERETRAMLARPGFSDLPAVSAGRVYAVDGSAMFNRPGPRLVDAFEWLCALLNDRPERLPAGFPARLVEPVEDAR